MYIAMNRFPIAAGRENDFIEVWRTRDSKLDEVPGFIEFHLLQGPEIEGGRVFISHSRWESYAHFHAWTESDAFKQAHGGKSRAPEGTYLGPPRFEGFEVVL